MNRLQEHLNTYVKPVQAFEYFRILSLGILELYTLQVRGKNRRLVGDGRRSSDSFNVALQTTETKIIRPILPQIA